MPTNGPQASHQIRYVSVQPLVQPPRSSYGNSRKAISGRLEKYAPIESTKVSKMKRVGPNAMTTSSSAIAVSMFRFDRILMPLSTPVVADSM